MKKTSGLNDKLIQRWKHAQRKTNLLPLEVLNETYTAAMREALDKLAEIASTISPVEVVTATNHGAERDKWLERAMKGEFTTPEFEYNRDLLEAIWQKRENLDLVNAEVRSAMAELPQDPAGKALRELIEARLTDVKSIIRLAGAILKGDVLAAKNATTAIYGLPSDRLVRRAKEVIASQKTGKLITQPNPILSEAERKRLAEIKLDAEAVRRVFLWAAEEYGLAGTRPILVREGVTAVTVHDAASEGAGVIIPATYEKDALHVPQLVSHEIGCHWRDSENMKLWIPQLGSGALKPLDELFYEGHALTTAYEIDLRVKGFVKEARQLYYPVAIKMAYKGELLFEETAQALYDLIKSESEPKEVTLQNVWQTTYRVYRGSPQMKQRSGYAFTKDRAYYAGRLLTQDLETAGLGYLLDYGTLSVKDLSVLMPVFQLRLDDGAMPYPEKDLTLTLYHKILKGEFLS